MFVQPQHFAALHAAHEIRLCDAHCSALSVIPIPDL
jgi:hypothetical protein